MMRDWELRMEKRYRRRARLRLAADALFFILYVGAALLAIGLFWSGGFE